MTSYSVLVRLLSEPGRRARDDVRQLFVRTHHHAGHVVEARGQHDLDACLQLGDGAAFDVNSTLPDWMYVATSEKPSASKHAFSAVILIRLLPPTFIPRSNATYLATTRF